MVSVLGPLFRTAVHTDSTADSAGQRRGDVELRDYLQSGREPESRV